MNYILIILTLLSSSFAAQHSFSVPGWNHIQTFPNGSLLAHASAPKTTLTTWNEKRSSFVKNKFQSKDYFEGLKIVRNKGLALGGLKGWKLQKIISEIKNEKYIELTFRGNYFRASGEEVSLTERHIFSENEFWQLQIVRDASKKILDAEDLVTFKRLNDEIIN